MLEATTIGAIVRAVLQVLSGMAGYDAAQNGEAIQAAASGLTFVATLVWSLWQKKQAKK